MIDYVELPGAARGRQLPPDPLGRARPQRPGLKPIEITQPRGAEFHHRRRRHRCAGSAGTSRWVSTSARGWSSTTSTIDDAGTRRPVLYRASIAEMMVPYGDPSPQRWFQNFFDCGEYLLGGYANSLELGCDCVGDITYLDAVRRRQRRRAYASIPQAICIHEEDTGILWKHSDNWNGSSDSRRNRRLVVSLLRHRRQLRLRLLLVLLASTERSSSRSRRPASCSPRPIPGAGIRVRLRARARPRRAVPPAPVQRPARHDGRRPRTTRSTSSRPCSCPRGPENPTGTGFTQTVTRLHTEAEAAAPRRQRAQPRLADHEPVGDRTGSASRRLRALPRGQARPAGRRAVRHPPARDVRHQAPVGHRRTTRTRSTRRATS